MLDVGKTIKRPIRGDYSGVLIPGDARSPALLAENQEVLSVPPQINDQKNWLPPFAAARCWSRSPVLPRVATIWTRNFSDLVIRPIVEAAVGFGAMTVPSASMEILCPRGTRCDGANASEAVRRGVVELHHRREDFSALHQCHHIFVEPG